jgi:hypothetical protein
MTRPMVVGLVLLVTLLACGGQQSSNDDDLETKVVATVDQTAIVNVAPSVTATAIIAPSPSPTARPTHTPTPTPTRTPAPRPTPTVAVTPTPELVEQTVNSCGGVTVRYYPWEFEVRSSLEEWNRIVDASNQVTDAWNAFVQASNEVLDFDVAIGSIALRDAATGLTSTVDTHRPALEAETDSGRFVGFAQAEIAALDVFRELATLTIAAVDGDVDAWNHSIDVWQTTDSVIAAVDLQAENGCGYFREHTD